MSSTQNPEADDMGAPGPVMAPDGKVGPVRSMSLGLWVVVGLLLSYGVVQTAMKAAALFA